MKGILASLIFICVYKFFVRAETEFNEHEICQPDGYQNCASSGDCCSNFCDKKHGEKLGLCKPGCGQSVVDETHPELEKFPWQANFYQYNASGFYQYYCGGTLISKKIVVTSAYCVSNADRYGKVDPGDIFTLRVALGKSRKSLNCSDDASAQIFEVESIELPSHYKGQVNFFTDDIAFVKLKTKVNYTSNVQPVCIDFEDRLIVEGAVGKTAGFGRSEYSWLYKDNEELMTKNLPFVPELECKDKVTKGLIPFLVRDKMCAGNASGDGKTWLGDIGACLVFKNDTTNTYYLGGILSLGALTKKEEGIALFTKFSAHKNIAEKYLDNCKRNCKGNLSQIT